MSRHRYSDRALRADYIRAGVGVVLTAGPLALVQPGLWVSLVLAGMALVFAGHGLRTWRRQRTVVEIGETEISTSGPTRVILPWAEVSKVRLRYYSTRRDRTGGWMQLTLATPGRRLKVESSIEGFERIARRAAGAVRANRLEIDTATRANLAALESGSDR